MSGLIPARTIVKTDNHHLFDISSNDHFRLRQVKHIFYITGAIRSGRAFDLLSASTTPELEKIGLTDPTDSLDSRVVLERVIYEKETERRILDVSQDVRAQFVSSARENYREMKVEWENEDVAAFGTVNLETGATSVTLMPRAPDVIVRGYNLIANRINLNKRERL